MKRIIILLSLLAIVPISQAQIGSVIGKKLKEKAEQTVNNALNKGQNRNQNDNLSLIHI